MQITIDKSIKIPISRQIAERLKEQIQSGEITYAEQLPSIKRMSSDLGVSCSTIKRAYSIIEQMGLVASSQCGTFVEYRDDYTYRIYMKKIAITRLGKEVRKASEWLTKEELVEIIQGV